MVENLLSVALGGIIAAIPTVISAISENKKFTKKLEHEMEIKRFELYEKDRMSALNDFLTCLGSLSSDILPSELDVDKYFSAAGKALCFVSEPVRNLIFESNALVSNWENGIEQRKLKHYQEAISSAIYAEYSSAFQHCDHLAAKANKK